MKQAVHIRNIIDKVLTSCRHDTNADLTEIWALWDNVVGQMIAENAQPAAFKGRILLVHVSSSIWIQQLQFLKKDIILMVNSALKKDLVEDIKFKIGFISAHKAES